MNLEEAKSKFQELYHSATETLKTEIQNHFFDSDDWTVSELEDIYGRTIVENVHDESDVEDGELPLSVADDKKTFRDTMEYNRFSLSTLQTFSEQFGMESKADIPYMIAVFSGNVGVDYRLDMNQWTENDLREIHVAKNLSEALEKVNDLLEENQGLICTVTDGDFSFSEMLNECFAQDFEKVYHMNDNELENLNKDTKRSPKKSWEH